MNQLKVLILISCLLFIFNCKTTPPVQFQENKQDQPSLIVVESKSSTSNIINVDINDEHTEYINMNEKTFMSLLNADFDKLSLIEGIWSNEQNTYKIGIQKAKEKGKYVAFILNSQEPSVKKGEVIAEFFETRYEYIYSTEYYLEDKTKIVTKTYIDDHGMLLIFLHEWEKESMAFFRSFPIKDATEEKKIISDLKQSLANEGDTGNDEYDVPVGNIKQSQSKEDEISNDEYYVQVVALKNYDDAQKLLVKIIKYYPKAYILVHNNFSKIRISDVLTVKQGAVVSSDIEKKFNLKPILVPK
jgi:hypothetical protein